MKKILITAYLLVMLLSLPCLAQESSDISKPTLKGNIILGGDLKFDFSNNFNKVNYPYGTFPVYEEYTSNRISFTIGPQAGYFLIDGLAIGISPSVSYSFTKLTNYSGSMLVGYKNHSIGWGVNAFAKYYLKNCIFFELESGYSHLKGVTDSFDPNSDYTYSIIPGVGYAIFLNSKVAIEPKINYEFNFSSTKNSSGSWYKQSSNGISLSAQFVIFL
jgi:hypothetical protein